MLLAIGEMTCDKLPHSVVCWENDDLTLKTRVYKTISIFPQRCVEYNTEEMWREVDNRCVFEYLCGSGFRHDLLHVLTPETVLVLVSPFPILPPHGLILITDAPECLLEIWINGHRVNEAEAILNYKLPVLFLGIRELLDGFVPDPLFFDIIMPGKFINWIKQQPKLVVNSTPWYVASLQYNIQRCTEFFKKEESGEETKQEGEEKLDDDEEDFSEPIELPGGCPINTPCGCCPT